MARLRLTMWLVLTVVGVLHSAACGSLDNVDYVHDLRMLAARADPPGQAIDPNALVEGAKAGTSSTTPISVTALVADPAGGGRTLNYEWATCAALDTNSQRCLPTGASYTVIASGSAQALNGYAEITALVSPSDALLVEAIAQDAYHGYGGLNLPVQLSVQAGDEHVTGIKLITYMPPYPGITYNAPLNPNIKGVTIEGAPWPAAGFTFASSSQPPDGWDITPLFDSNAQATYQVPSFQGDVLTLTESWMFDFFTTFATGFTPTSTGGVTLANNVENPVDSHWKPAVAQEAQAGLFYVVVRTGRGGENWVILPATWTPSPPG